MGRRTQIAGDTAVAAGVGVAGAVIGGAVAGAIVNRWSLWWLMAPLSALYHLAAALICVFSGRPLVVVVVLLAEALWVIVAARVGRRDGGRAHDASLAQDLVAQDPTINVVLRLQALSVLEPLTRPAQGHDLALAFCWFSAPLQTAAYRTAFSQSAAAESYSAPAEYTGSGLPVRRATAVLPLAAPPVVAGSVSPPQFTLAATVPGRPAPPLSKEEAGWASWNGG